MRRRSEVGRSGRINRRQSGGQMQKQPSQLVETRKNEMGEQRGHTSFHVGFYDIIHECNGP